MARESAVVVDIGTRRAGGTTRHRRRRAAASALAAASAASAAGAGTRQERQCARAALARALRPDVGVADSRDPMGPLKGHESGARGTAHLEAADLVEPTCLFALEQAAHDRRVARSDVGAQFADGRGAGLREAREKPVVVHLVAVGVGVGVGARLWLGLAGVCC